MKFLVLYVSCVVTTIWSQRAPRCHMRFCMLNTNEDPVPEKANRSRRSARVPWVRLGHETSSFIITSHKQRAVFESGLFQRKIQVLYAFGHPQAASEYRQAAPRTPTRSIQTPTSSIPAPTCSSRTPTSSTLRDDVIMKTGPAA